jgi:glucose-1-phosphate adenylyltransferase
MLGADFYEGEEVLNPRYHPTGNQPNLGIGQNCRIEGAIIDKNARIGHNVVIRPKVGKPDYESDTYWIRDGLTIIPKGAAVPDGTVI